MTDQGAMEAHQTGRSVRLDTLVRLRWLAVIGQTIAVLVVYFGLDYELPIWACLAVIALAAWLNVALRIRFPMTQRLEPDRAAWLLAFAIGNATAVAQAPTPPATMGTDGKHAMSKACSDQANANGLHGDERKKFRAACMKSDTKRERGGARATSA